MNTLNKYAFAVPVLLSFSLSTAQNAPLRIASHIQSQADLASLPSGAPDVQGYYFGELSNGGAIAVHVLEDGEFWLFSPTDSNLWEVIQGKGYASSGTFTSDNAVILGGGPTMPVTFSANYAPGSSINGTLALEASTPLTFSATYSTRYETPYPVATIAGNYSGVLQVQDRLQRLEMTVYNDGTLQGQSVDEQIGVPCTFAGNVVQRSALTNPYAASITFSGEPSCVVFNETMTGTMSVGAAQNPEGSFYMQLAAVSQDRDTLVHIISVQDAAATPSSEPAPPPASDGSVIDGGFLLE